MATSSAVLGMLCNVLGMLCNVVGVLGMLCNVLGVLGMFFARFSESHIEDKPPTCCLISCEAKGVVYHQTSQLIR